ncbi:MAG TPA: alpha/beta fold hydrolase [Nitrospiraceae bacterium]|jgi:pimeloyl-ACP methyl ester carboxylesterase|nr:alpha/beta fold hydrolase [Nitrospiraceae bacterium]
MMGGRGSRWVFVLLSIVFTASCERVPRIPDPEHERLKGHYFFIDRDGYGLNREAQPVTSEQFDELAQPILDGLRARAAQQSKCADGTCRLKVLLFLHGGMNGYATGVERMRHLVEADPGERHLPALLSPDSSDYYPIFLNWNSAPLDATGDDLLSIRFAERQSWPVVGFTLPFVLIGRTAQTLGNIPVSLVHIGFNIKEGFMGGIQAGDSYGCTIADAIAYAPMIPFYAVTAPLLEGFGVPAWNIMKRRAELAVANRLPGNQHHVLEGAAYTFLRRLLPALQDLPVPVELTVVGHSMGSILLNRLLPQLQPSDHVIVRHIVYLAPAINLEEINHYLLPFVRDHAQADVSIFTLNRRDEAREVALNGWIFMFPRGSLLTWVDTFFEPASVMEEETAGRIRNLEEYYACDLKDQPSDVKDCPPSSRRIREPKPPSRWGFTRRPLHATGDLPLDRVQLFEAVRDLNQNWAPEHHGDFSQPRFLAQALCQVDYGAFKTGVCDEHLEYYSPAYREDHTFRICGMPTPFKK